MICIKCGNEIPTNSKSVKYCSVRCSTLYLKSEFRKRNKDKINAYRRKIRKEGYKSFFKDKRSGTVNKLLFQGKDECLICGSLDNVEIHHIKPRRCGGLHVIGNVMLLCKKCHYDFEEATKHFWNKS